MLAVLIVGVLGTAFSAVIDPTLTEWRLLETDHEQVMFPIRDYILEVKAFRPDVYDTNPLYTELFKTDKPTTMMAILFAGNWNNQVGRLVWNNIKYVRPYDIAIEECDARYQAYPVFPANGEKEQIWAWNFFEDHVELTCNGVMMYEQNFDEGDLNPRKPGLPEKCRALGDAEVDRITFKHMAGEYIRAVPKDGIIVEPTTAITDPLTEPPTGISTPGLPDDLKTPPVTYPTCNCWTEECNFCANLDCTVQHDLIGSQHDIEVTSKLSWRKLNSIMLYDGEGNAIGSFEWSLQGILLTGCVNCQTPGAIRSIEPGTADLWVFTMVESEDGGLLVQIKMGGEVLWEQELTGECAERYGQVNRFAFFDSTCEGTFKFYPDDMLAGDRITEDCAGACLEDEEE
ncbi:hypothetical protein ACHWQZ_G016608 [Mnemiopsis leidyi]